jgi:protein-L-isoaspartate(D-aspartate) O-methyltransferase
MQDTYRHQGLRKRLLTDLRKKGITDERVLVAMAQLPRHVFLEKAFEEWAYQDKAFPIGCEQTISQPYTVAFQSSLLDVEKRQKILEIGTGSGYQAAVLSLMGGRVFTIERHKPLHLKAKRILAALNIGGIRFYHRDGYKGIPELAPFDRIIVTAGAPQVPEALKMQLKIGGKLVIPVGEKHQRMLRISRVGENEWQEEDFGDFQFVPFLPGVA